MKAASCEEAFMSALMELVHDVGTKCRVPGSHPKEGWTLACDNWCGISLLDVVGKVVARVLQCGYKRGIAGVSVWVQE